jgi:hypothetical protein
MKIASIFAALFTLVIAACTSPNKIISWKKETTAQQQYTKILVLGFMRSADNDIRENTEGLLSEYMRNAEINAVSSLELYGTKVFDRMDEDDALYQLNNSCVDAVLSITLLNKKKEKEYVPGTIHYTPYSYYYDHFWRYRNTVNHRIYEAGYYTDNDDVFIECNLYDMKTQKLVYSVQTKSFHVSDYDSMGKIYGKLIVKDLLKKKVLKSP